MEEGDERDRRGELADLAEQAGELRDDRDPPRREPGGDEPQHAREGHRVAGADEDATRHGEPDGVRLGQHDLADAHDRRARGDHAAGADAVEHRADRDLQAGVDGELQDDEEAEHGRRRAEALLRLGPGDPQRGAMEDGDAVGRDAQPPHQPGAA